MRVDIESKIMRHCGSCNYCRDTCPMYIELGSELDSPGGKIRALRAYAEKMRKPPQELLERLYCADCRRCEAICPAGVPVTSIWHDAKATLLNTGGVMSENLVKVIDWLEKEGTPFIGYESEDRTVWAEDLELPPESNTAIFSGCMGSFWYPDQPEMVVDMLTKLKVNAGYVPSEVCCGLMSYWAGDDKGFEETARKNYAMFKKAGIQHIVTGCGGCFGTLAEHYSHFIPEFDVQIHHTVEVLADMVRNGVLTFKGKEGRYTFHDSCHLGRALGIYREPREIINAIPGLELVEMPNNKENSNCCGGFLTVLDPDLSESVGKRRVNEAVELGVDGMVTTCISCYKNLSYCARETDLEVVQLDELILDLAQSSLVEE
ncbi:MAG: (Fe-S)-binding protein [Candidatus Thorarchaeota archaeon]|nr:MAG: (Fe-S)-binding protein [Candidatus Thorarchaeota archaeon]